MTYSATAAIVTVGTEIVSGLRLDTNTREIARELLLKGFDVREALSVADDPVALAEALSRLMACYDLVMVTGGLGPTHDDITREAAAQALQVGLHRDESLAAGLARWAERHSDPVARSQVYSQADVLEGARVLFATTGTAPGQIATTPHGGRLVLLPGPPSEMRPMLTTFLAEESAATVAPVELACVGITESDAQLLAQEALKTHAGVGLALLAAPGDVHVTLFDRGAGADGLNRAAAAVSKALGERCYSSDGRSMAKVVIDALSASYARIAVAESCTGGLVGAALSSVPGASEVFLGGVIAYDNEVKSSLLDVPPGLLAQYGAVSEETARAMAEGVRDRLGSDIGIATTGVAGPGGGTDRAPVGTVWFAIADRDGSRAQCRTLAGDRDGIRIRATLAALDIVRLNRMRNS